MSYRNAKQSKEIFRKPKGKALSFSRNLLEKNGASFCLGRPLPIQCDTAPKVFVEQSIDPCIDDIFLLCKIRGESMLLIGGAVGFMSGVLLMFFLLGLRVSEEQVIDLAGTLIAHNPIEARTRSAKTFLQVPGSRA